MKRSRRLPRIPWRDVLDFIGFAILTGLILSGIIAACHGAKIGDVVCLVKGPDGSGAWNVGSGAAVSETHILTAAHVVRDDQRIEIHYRGQAIAVSRVVLYEPNNDISLLETASPHGIPPTCVANQSLQQGERIYYCGFKGGRELVGAWAPVTGAYNSGGTIEWGGQSISGMSGGPCFNQDGEIVSVISGSDGRISVGASVQSLRECRLYLTQCYGGQCQVPGYSRGGGVYIGRYGYQQPTQPPVQQRPPPQPATPQQPPSQPPQQSAKPNGDNCCCDCAKQLAAMQQRIQELENKPWQFRLEQPDGKISDRENIRLGDSLTLRLRPVTKPSQAGTLSVEK